MAKWKKLKKIFTNNLVNDDKIVFITEDVDWVITDICKNVANGVKKDFGISVGMAFTNHLLRNKILHFGSIGTLIRGGKICRPHKSNKVVVTWFHIEPNDKRIQHIKELNTFVDVVHTACNITKKQLIVHGFDKEKIKIVPIGMDVGHFSVLYNKSEAKKALNLPMDKVIIGSFQKDGNGWGEGMDPKLVKGPDVFCDVVEYVNKKHPVHVLLTGPARGYVKQRLEKAKIPYTHRFLEEYNEIVKYFHALDLYIVASRVEGGPKAILEAWACGVPLVATKVGMIADIAQHNYNALLADVEDVGSIASYTCRIIEDSNLQKKLIEQGKNSVKEFDWPIVANMYVEKLYKDLL